MGNIITPTKGYSQISLQEQPGRVLHLWYSELLPQWFGGRLPIPRSYLLALRQGLAEGFAVCFRAPNGLLESVDLQFIPFRYGEGALPIQSFISFTTVSYFVLEARFTYDEVSISTEGK